MTTGVKAKGEQNIAEVSKEIMNSQLSILFRVGKKQNRTYNKKQKNTTHKISSKMIVRNALNIILPSLDTARLLNTVYN